MIIDDNFLISYVTVVYSSRSQAQEGSCIYLHFVREVMIYYKSTLIPFLSKFENRYRLEYGGLQFTAVE